MPAEVNLVQPKGRSKKKLVSALNSNGNKVIFTLLTEVVAFHMGLTAVHVWEAGFEGFVLGLFRGGKSSSLPNGLADLLGIEKLELLKKSYSYQTWSRVILGMFSIIR